MYHILNLLYRTRLDKEHMVRHTYTHPLGEDTLPLQMKLRHLTAIETLTDFLPEFLNYPLR